MSIDRRSAGNGKSTDAPKVTTVGQQQHIKLGEAQALIEHHMAVERRAVYAVLRFTLLLSVLALVVGAVAIARTWR